MLLKINCCNGTLALINTGHISCIEEKTEEDEFYKSKTKYCVIMLENGYILNAKYSLNDLEYLINPNTKASVSTTEEEVNYSPDTYGMW